MDSSIYMRRNFGNIFSLGAKIFSIDESGLPVVQSNQPKVIALKGKIRLVL
jgi:hypothetical protein